MSSSSLLDSILFHLCNPVCLVVRFMQPMQSAVAAFVLGALSVPLFCAGMYMVSTWDPANETKAGLVPLAYPVRLI